MGKMKVWKKEENSTGKQTKDGKNHLRSFMKGNKQVQKVHKAQGSEKKIKLKKTRGRKINQTTAEP